MNPRVLKVLAVLSLAFAAAVPARAGNTAAGSAATANRTGCAGQSYTYAGLQNRSNAHGVSGTLVERAAPTVIAGHVAGWIGLGTGGDGPGGEWLQVGYVAFSDQPASQLYYEIANYPKASYHEVQANVLPGESHRLAVLEINGRDSWWRVWVDGKPVSPPIHLPGSHGTWAPQAIGENGNNGSGACNGFSYEFSGLAVAGANGGGWRPFKSGYVFEDRGYQVVHGATSTRFLAQSV